MIAVVVPTIRIEKFYHEFVVAWDDLFKKHDVQLLVVKDKDEPELLHFNTKKSYSISEVMGEDSDLIYNKNDGVRNLGFAYIAKYMPEIDYTITLDDDTRPLGDTIEDHITALRSRVPISWVSTASEYMRGFPYKIREEAEVVLSHGIWQGVADWDAPTQLVLGNRHVGFYQGPIPKGVFYPMCGMNIAFKRKMLPYMYYAPMGYKVGLDRFADIWLGIESKKVIDENGWAVVTGMAGVRHERASNVWKNLQKEAKGLEMNENYGEDEYFRLYERQRERWKDLLLPLI